MEKVFKGREISNNFVDWTADAISEAESLKIEMEIFLNDFSFL